MARHRGFSHTARVLGGRKRGKTGLRGSHGRYLRSYNVSSSGMQGILRHTKSSGSNFRAPIQHKQIISMSAAEAGRMKAERSLLGRKSYKKRIRTSFGRAEVHVQGIGPKKYQQRLQTYNAKTRYKIFDPNYKAKHGGF